MLCVAGALCTWFDAADAAGDSCTYDDGVGVAWGHLLQVLHIIILGGVNSPSAAGG